MAAQVLEAGARSIFLDVEPHSGFWKGTTQDALAFGAELRRLAPNGKVVLSIDPRPWTLRDYPLREFASFSDAVAPQQYWRTFNTPANHRRFAESGYPVPPDGVTPEFLLNVSKAALAPLGKPLLQVGQGATDEQGEFKRFIDGAYGHGGDMVTVWRYGVTSDDVFRLLRATPPRRPAPPARAVAAGGVYKVVSGDTLSGIAAAHGVPMSDLANLNGLSDPYTLSVGQELKIPGGSNNAAAAAAAPSSGGTYSVQPGDTLSAIASKTGTSVDALSRANGINDVNSLQAGQELKLP
jgi:LysM repeat protein